MHKPPILHLDEEHDEAHDDQLGDVLARLATLIFNLPYEEGHVHKFRLGRHRLGRQRLGLPNLLHDIGDTSDIHRHGVELHMELLDLRDEDAVGDKRHHGVQAGTGGDKGRHVHFKGCCVYTRLIYVRQKYR